MKQYILGLDNGGTVIKAALFDLQGREVAVASMRTAVITPAPGYNERDMEDLWQRNCACAAQVIRDSGVDPGHILAMAVSGHGKGLYVVDKDGAPAYNGIMSTDNRAWRYPQKWREEGTFDRLYPQLCQQLIPCQQAALCAWLKDNEPHVYQNTRWVLSAKDYIRLHLTGEAYSEATDVSGSGLMDVRGVRFDRTLLEALGIGEVYDKLPPLRYSSDLCGAVTAEAARLTGLKAGTPVAGGMFDIDACAIAMAITRPEQLCTITGTWTINEFISATPLTGTEIAMNSLYAMPGYYLLEECSATSAGNLEWVLNNCMAGVTPREGQSLYAHADQLVAAIHPGQCDVYYLPFLYGSNAHPLAKASFIGLTTYHDTGHMLRAVYEGVAYAAKTHIQRLLSAREPPAAVRMAGGVVNSPMWVQMYADILNLPIETVRGVKELGALGAAMSASVAAGIYPGYEAAAAAMVRVSEPVLPDKDRAAVYQRKYETYTKLVQALDGVWDAFAV